MSFKVRQQVLFYLSIEFIQATFTEHCITQSFVVGVRKQIDDSKMLAPDDLKVLGKWTQRSCPGWLLVGYRWAGVSQSGSIEKVPGRCGSGVSASFTAHGSLHLSYRPGTMKPPTGLALLALLFLAASLPSEISSESRPCLSASLFHCLNLIWSFCYQRFRKKWILNSIREKPEE